MARPDDESRAPKHEREEEFARLLGEYVDLWSRGEAIDEAEILAVHPVLGPELTKELRTFVSLGERAAEPATRTFGDYKILQQIGRGGMGVVYEAWQTSVERRVALKLLPAGVAADAKVLSRFVREARTAASLRHPSVVSIYGMGVEAETPYFAMEYVDGETVEQMIRRLRDAEGGDSRSTDVIRDLSLRLGSSEATTETTEPAETADRTISAARGAPRASQLYAEFFSSVTEAFAGVADGLHHAHEHGVVHRDIKPSNLVLDEEGRLRILDFGLAHQEGLDRLTATGQILGTPLYMSPEQVEGSVDVGARSDVYSLGATLYEFLVLHPPVKGRDRRETLNAIVRSDPEAPHTRNPRVPKDLETIVLKCLQKESCDRYQTALALAEDLRRFERGEPITASPPSEWQRLTRRLRRSKTLVSAIVVLALTAAGAGFVLPRWKTISVSHVWDTPSLVSVLGTVSDDGKLVSGVHWEAGNLLLYELRDETSRLLTKNVEWADTGGWAEESVISPDGELVAYNWFRELDDAVYDLRVIGVDGTGMRVLLYTRDIFWIRPFAWSSGQDSILVDYGLRDHHENGLALVSVDGSGWESLRSWNRRQGPNRAVFSPDDRYVVFDLEAEDAPGSHDIHVLDRETGEERAIVRQPSNDSLLGWVPGHDAILYSSDRKHRPSVWWLRLTGGAPDGAPVLLQRGFSGFPVGFAGDGSFFYGVTLNASDVHVASIDPETRALDGEAARVSSRFLGQTQRGEWSPDGSRLAYIASWSSGSSGPQGKVILIHTVETGRERIIDPDPRLYPGVWMAGPRWTTDGESLLIAGRSIDRQAGLLSVDVDDGSMRLLIEIDPPPRRIVLAPNGESVYGVPRREDRIVRYDLRTGDETVIYDGPLWAASFDVSPDGTRIAMFAEEDMISFLPATGGEATPAFGVGNAHPAFARFSADGEHLMFGRRGREIWVRDLAGGAETLVATDLGGLRRAAPQPGGDLVTFTTHNSSSELWVMADYFPKD